MYNSILFKNISFLDEKFKIKNNMCILVTGSEISYIGKYNDDLEADYIYDGKNKLALPAFYNLHCHVPMTMLRGYGDGLPLQKWLFNKIFPFEAKLTEEDMYWATLHGSMEMIRSGVASFSDMYFHVPNIAKAVEEIGIKANLSHGVGGNGDNINFKNLPAYRDTEYLIKKYSNNLDSRIKIDASIHAEYTSNESLVRQVSEYAKEKNLIVHLHISETVLEQEECKKRHNGMNPVEYFNHCGLFENKCLLAHAVHLEENDYNILSSSKDISVCHNVSSNLKLGSGFCDIVKLLKNSINVTLGTDGASSNNNLNMLEEIHLASMIQKGLHKDPSVLSPEETIKLSTINGAKAQGRSKCGSIKVGNRADIIVFDMSKLHLQPIFDSLANVVYSSEASDIVLNMVDGKILYKDGEFLTVDKDRVIHEIKTRTERILSEL